MQKVVLQDWGLIDYREAWDRQSELMQHLIGIKRGKVVTQDAPAGYFILCAHPPVYTLGKSGSEDNLKLSESQLDDRGIDYFKINRGGDITFHGPGQIVGYPILDMDQFYRDVHKYVRMIEEVIIRTIGDFGLDGLRLDDFTGVWLSPNVTNPNYRKICAIGVHLSRWVSMHGFALNVNTDLDYFDHIIPCGISDENKEVTSIAKELGKNVDPDEVKANLQRHFADLFQAEFIQEKSKIRE